MTDGPVFILCCARSGSTLLSRLLGMHPEIAAPAETNLGAACANLVAACETLGREAAGIQPGADRVRRRAVSRVTRVGNSLIREYLRTAGKAVLCDKSLTNEMCAGQLAEIFPQAMFIVLFRHCLDVIDSLIEASPWGFSEYGIAPYIGRSAGSFVAGIAEMWLASTERQLAFAASLERRVSMIRYEDMVTDPARAIARIYQWLGLPALPRVPGSAADPDGGAAGPPVMLPSRAQAGPSDHKIAFTRSVEAASIGRGRRVPLAFLPEQLQLAVSERLTVLGYAPLGQDWNVRPVARIPHEADGPRAALAPVLAELTARISRRDPAGGVARIAVEDADCTVVADFAAQTIRLEPGLADPLYAGSVASLLGVVLGGVNLGTTLRRGDLRLCRPGEASAAVVEALLGLLAFREPETV